MAVSKHLLSRIDVIIQKEMKDEQILRILQESEKESDSLRQKAFDFEEENQALKERLEKRGKRKTTLKEKTGSNVINISKASKDPKFVIGEEENKTISDISADEVHGHLPIYLYLLRRHFLSKSLLTT